MRKKNDTCATVRKAKRIYAEQKKSYKQIFDRELHGHLGRQSSKAAAKAAGKEYRAKYGATPTKRWHNALKRAKQECGR